MVKSMSAKTADLWAVKRHLCATAVALLPMWSALSAAQVSAASVVALDSALDAIISTDAKLEVLFTGLTGTEGPVWVKKGRYLLFVSSSPTDGRVYKVTSDGGRSTLLEGTGGATALALDGDDRLLICGFHDKTLVRIERDGTRTILAREFEGRPLNGPNDLAVKSDGSIYFTDELSVFRWKAGRLEQLMKSVIPGGRIVDGASGGRVVNGIALSPDEKFLYLVVVPTRGSRKIARYELGPDGAIVGKRGPDGTITDERIWFPLPEQTPPATRQSGQPDGIKVDLNGNVYFGGPSGLWIVSPAGKHLGTVLIPGGHSNLAFGDADGKGLYLTTGSGLARIRLQAAAI